MTHTLIDNAKLTGLANKIRTEVGISRSIYPRDMSHLIDTIDTQDPWSWVKDDDNTYLHLNVWNPALLTINPYFKLIGTINWGDGTVETYSDSALTTHTHTYASAGRYVICIEANDNADFQLGGTSSTYTLMGENTTTNKQQMFYLEKLQVGKATLNTYGLRELRLQALYFSKNITNLPSNCCNSLQVELIYLAAPLVTLGQYAFGYTKMNRIYGNNTTIQITSTYAFRQIENFSRFINCTLDMKNSQGYVFYGTTEVLEFHYKDPFTYTQFPNYFFKSAKLYYANIPSNITSITCDAAIVLFGELHCAPTAPPTLSRAMTCKTGAKIYVPKGSLNAYKSASNWSSSADYMEEKS